MTLTPGFTPVCAQDGEMWFAPGGSIDDHNARAICRQCPAQLACLQVALDAEGAAVAQMRFGVFGGLDGSQRAALYRKQLKETA